MHVAIGIERLGQLGGTETYVLTVAEALERLGHRVTVRAQEAGGPAADLAARRGVCVGEPDGPDAALAVDAPSALALAGAFPGVPLVLVAMSDLFAPQLPPLADGVVTDVVALSDRVARHLGALAAPLRVHRLRQPVDTVRFQPGGPLPARPRRALLLSNYLRGDRRGAVERVFGEAGITCVAAGTTSEVAPDTASLLHTVDVVVGKARALLEGMACGKGAFLADAGGADGWVTADRWAALEAEAFGGGATELAFAPDALRAELAAYDPAMGVVNRDLVTRHHSARVHADALVGLLRDAGVPPEPAPPAWSELARAGRLLWRAEEHAWRVAGAVEARDAERAALHAELDAARGEGETLRARVHDLDDQLAATRARLGELEGRVAAADRLVVERDAEVARLRALLGTRRARLALAAGRAADRLRGRR